MLQQPILPDVTHGLPRAIGALRADFAPHLPPDSVGGARLTNLRQSGSAKGVLTSPDCGELVILNTSGGLTGGDDFSVSVGVQPGARLTVTTQTAERAYRSTTGQAQVRMRYDVGDGGHLDLVPQETILFDRASLRRDQIIALHGRATCLWAEMLILGRAAMGETVKTLDLRDSRRITRDGEPLFIEKLRLDQQALARTSAAVLGHGTRAIATIIAVRADAADLIRPLRNIQPDPGVRMAASAFDGKLVLRMTAPDGWPLRRTLIRLLAVLRNQSLPRVWQS